MEQSSLVDLWAEEHSHLESKNAWKICQEICKEIEMSSPREQREAATLVMGPNADGGLSSKQPGEWEGPEVCVCCCTTRVARRLSLKAKP